MLDDYNGETYEVMYNQIKVLFRRILKAIEECEMQKSEEVKFIKEMSFYKELKKECHKMSKKIKKIEKNEKNVDKWKITNYNNLI